MGDSLLFLRKSLGYTMRSSITQYNITWTFDTSYKTGQYVTGDYWVVDEGSGVTVSSISPAPVRAFGEDNTGRNGSKKNPDGTEPHIGYDSRARYDANKITYYDPYECDLPPISLSAGDALISQKSCPNGTAPSGPYGVTTDGAVLTCVDEPQPVACFRPPYCRPTRPSVSASDPLRFNSNDVLWGNLPSISSVTGTPSLASTTAKCVRPWIDHSPNWQFCYVMPSNNCGDYGQYIAERGSEIGLQLCLNYTQAQKTEMCLGFIQAGIDLYGVLEDGCGWNAAGGIFQGRKFPIIFAGWMLNHAGMKSPRTNTPHWSAGQNPKTFGEDGQCYAYNDAGLPDYATKCGVYAENPPFAVKGVKGWIDITNGGDGDLVLWRMRDYASGVVDYNIHEHLHTDDWCGGENTEPGGKSDGYRRANTSPSWVGTALACKIMGIDTIWNYAPFFDYTWRWMTQDDSNAIAAVYAKWAYTPWPAQGYLSGPVTTFVQNMWNTYAATYW